MGADEEGPGDSGTAGALPSAALPAARSRLPACRTFSVDEILRSDLFGAGSGHSEGARGRAREPRRSAPCGGGAGCLEPANVRERAIVMVER